MCRMLVATIAVALLPAMASAQTDSTATSPKKEKLSEKMSRLLKRARTSMENAGHQLGDAIGFDDRIDSGYADSILIEGTYYMPLYDTSLYRGSDAMIYTDESRKLFAERYPEVEMLTVCLPQQEWITETVRMGNVVVGYRQTMHCFIIGKDGDDGYVNAKFTFRRYKEVGKQYRRVSGQWPLWEKTDIIPNNIYEKLKSK